MITDELRASIYRRVRGYDRRTLNPAGFKRAAVALIILDYASLGNLAGMVPAGENEGALLLTRRSTGLKSHSGQWALPGGRIDDGESVEEAALREAREEVFLEYGAEQILGLLDDYTTRSGYHITPVVIWGGTTGQIRMNKSEVASVHRISFSELMREDSPWISPGAEPERPVLYIPVGDTCIASPTAAIIYQFRELALYGRDTRVSHYDQPGFAWR